MVRIRGSGGDLQETHGIWYVFQSTHGMMHDAVVGEVGRRFGHEVNWSAVGEWDR